MLRITVEIVPFGIEENKRQIGIMEIANFGWIEGDKCKYLSRMDQKEKWDYLVTHHRSDGFWKLLQIALESREKPCTK